MTRRLRRCLAFLAACALVAGGAVWLGRGAWAEPSSGKGGPQKSASGYQVFAFNDLGMHCYDPEYSVFAILPLFNNLHAQVVRQGAEPEILTDATVQVYYDALQDPMGSINTSSSGGKTQFWMYAERFFGSLATGIQVDEGLKVPPDMTSAWMPGMGTIGNNVLQPFIHGFDPAKGWFSVEGIPMTVFDDTFAPNPYSLFSVEAYMRKTRLDTLPTVVPVSQEMNCSHCHATGDVAASDPAITWSQSTDPVIQYRENILILHDYEFAAEYPPSYGPAGYSGSLMSNKPVLCAWCHYSPVLDLTGAGPPFPDIAFFSQTMHGSHAPRINQTETLRPCFYCHPGPVTQCLRGAMSLVGIGCVDCHGNMYAIAQPTRTPWFDLPRCEYCHSGDAVTNPGGPLIYTTTYTNSDPTNPAFRLSPGSRFAANAGTLYRNSLGHEGIACESCHGSPHAIWATRETNDNLAAIDIQGHDGMIIECTACHGSGFYPPSGEWLDGPHGMHVVNSQTWVDGHHSLFEGGQLSMTTCQPCHGQFGEGTVLSKAAADRTFQVDERGRVTIAKGTQIGCGLCHENVLSGVGNDALNAANGDL